MSDPHRSLTTLNDIAQPPASSNPQYGQSAVPIRVRLTNGDARAEHYPSISTPFREVGPGGSLGRRDSHDSVGVTLASRSNLLIRFDS